MCTPRLSKTAPGHITAYTRRESRRRHNTITAAADPGCLRAFSLVATPLLHTEWGDLSGRVSSASGWNSLAITRMRWSPLYGRFLLSPFLGSKGLKTLPLGKVPCHQAISYPVGEGRESHPLLPNTVKLVRKDRKNIWSRRKGSDTGISPQLRD